MITIANDELFELVDALLKCQNIDDGASRDVVLGMLKEQVPFLQTVAIPAAPRVAMIAVVRGCLRYSGCLDPLPAILAGFELSSKPFSAFERLRSEIFAPGVVSYDQRAALVAMVPAALMPDEPTLRALCDASVHFGSSLFAPEEATITFWRALRRLANLSPQSAGLFPFPILEFVERLAEYATDKGRPEVGAALTAWVDQQAPMLPGLTQADLDAMRRNLRNPAAPAAAPAAPAAIPAVASAPADAPLLLVEIVPRNKNAQQFTAHAWLGRGAGEGSWLVVDKQLKGVEKLKAWLNDVVLEARRALVAHKDALTIEFLLPRELLCLDVDQWLITLNKRTPIGLGEFCPVVVRWRDRSRDAELVSSWPDKWKRLQTLGKGQPAGAAKQPIHWVDTAGDASLNFFRSLAASLRDPDVVCMALPFAPPTPPHTPHDILYTALDVGVPVAVWVRDNAPDLKNARAKIERFLANQTLAELPAHVLAQRQEAIENRDSNHVGNYLTLLWDDPSRQPPAPQMAAPRRTGGTG